MFSKHERLLLHKSAEVKKEPRSKKRLDTKWSLKQQQQQSNHITFFNNTNNTNNNIFIHKRILILFGELDQIIVTPGSTQLLVSNI